VENNAAPQRRRAMSGAERQERETSPFASSSRAERRVGVLGRIGRTRWAIVGAMASLLGGFSLTAAQNNAGAAVPGPVLAPHSVISFPVRDFVSSSGFLATDSVTVQILRNNVVVGHADNVVPADDPATPGFDGLVDINHPGGACWIGTTPNIKAGDVVRLTVTDNLTNTVTSIEQTTTANVVVTEPAAAGAVAGSVVVKGTAEDSVGNPLPLGQIEQRMIAKNDPFAVNGRRTIRAGVAADGTLSYDPIGPGNANGTHWTATYSGLTPADIARAVAAESRILWLGAVALPAVESTIYEFGAVPGPAAPCTAPLDGPIATPSAASLLYTAQDQTTTSAPKTVTITNTGHGVPSVSALNISAVTTVGPNAGDFAATSDCAPPNGPFAIDGACTISVTFTPTGNGLRNANLEITSDAAGGGIILPLVGYGQDVGAPPVPVAFVSPTTISFATRNPGSASLPQGTTVTNLGGADLVVSGVQTNNSDFAASLGTCGAAVPSGASCAPQVIFTPSVVGPRTATLQLAHNAAGSPSAVSLVGAGLATTGVNEPPVAPHSILVFSVRDFVSASGYAEGDLVTAQVIRHGVVVGQVSDMVPIDDPTTPGFDGIVEVNHPGGSCWTGTTPDIRPGDVVRYVTQNGQADQTTTVNVAVTTAPAETSPGTITVKGIAADADGKPLPLGQLTQRFIAKKDAFDINGRRAVRAGFGGGDGVLTFDPITAENPQGIAWTSTYTGLTPADVNRFVNTSEARIIWLGHDPLALTEGTFYEYLQIGGPAPAFCSSPAEPPSPDVKMTPRSLTFPNRTVGASSTSTLTLTNTGTAPLSVSSFTFNGTDFAVDSETCTAGTVAPNTSCAMTVRFTPTQTGNRNDVLHVNDNVVGTPHDVPLLASGLQNAEAQASVNPDALLFSDLEVGVTSAPQTITVTNVGQADLIFPAGANSASVNGPQAADFAIAADGCAGQTVAAGATCTETIKVTFTPGFLGTRTATLRLNAQNVAVQPTVSLFGTSSVIGGVNDPPRAPHSILDFPQRDFVTGSGYTANELVDVEVWRGNNRVGFVNLVVPVDDPKTAGFDGLVDVNHPGGACWSGITPDIKAGDIVRYTAHDAANLATITSRDQTVVQNVVVTQAAFSTGPGSITVKGWARDVRGNNGQIPIGQVQVRLINKNRFEANGRRDLRAGSAGDGTLVYDSPSSTNFTATFTGLSAADVNAAIASESRAVWLGHDPAALLEATLYEFGAVGGPAAGVCDGIFGAPILSVAPNPANLGAQAVGTAVPNLRVLVTNTGLAAADFQQETAIVGPDAADFNLVAVAPGAVPPVCNGGLDVGATCQIVVGFTPSRLGAHSATLQINSDAVNAPNLIPLTGLGIIAPTVTSFTPVRGAVGRLVTINGSGFTATSSVRFNTTPAATFSVVNDATLAAVVPAGATDGQITVTNPAGASTSVDSFTVVDPPTITGFTPTTGGAGTVVTINGTDLNTTSTVRFNGTAAASFTVVSDTRITATVAAGTTTGPITVTNEAGPATSVANFVFIPPPSITAAPASGRVGDGVTITGTNFTGATVRFNGTLATATVTATQIRTNVPAGATTGPLTVTTPGGTASANFTVIIPPTITGFAPNQAGVGGVVTITGTNFVSVSKVSLGGTTVTTFTVDSPTQIRATVPTGAKSGVVQVTAIGGTVNSAAQFTFVPAPTITSFTPTTGPVGTTITITGTNLTTTNAVTFLGAGPRVPGVVTVVSATQVRVVVPVGARTGAIQLTTVGGTATSATAFGVTP